MMHPCHAVAMCPAEVECSLLQIFMLFLTHAYACQHQFRLPQNKGPLPMDASSNMQHFGRVVIDGGIYQLWPCFIPWLLFEADMGYAWLHHISSESKLLSLL